MSGTSGLVSMRVMRRRLAFVSVALLLIAGDVRAQQAPGRVTVKLLGDCRSTGKLEQEIVRLVRASAEKR